MKTVTLFILLILLFTEAFADNKLTGEWAIDCDGMPFSRIYNEEGVSKIQLASNQIYIEVRYESSDKSGGGLYVFFEDTIDLGRGGINFPWSEFSKVKPIGQFIFQSDREGILDWKGFFTKEGLFVDVPSDFYEKSKLYKCSN